MFIQVITADVVDRSVWERQADKWDSELRPGAIGFLGATSGITDNDRLVVMARFASQEEAQQSSDRPEQGEWWAETEKGLSNVEFKNSVEVLTMMGGGSDNAGFVQVMRGHITDKEKADAVRAKMDETAEQLRGFRPDVIGDVIAVHADGTYTNAVYFTSEAEAREGEKKELPAEAASQMQEMMEVFPVDEFLDLKQPRLV
jgi:hypothetical protein